MGKLEKLETRLKELEKRMKKIRHDQMALSQELQQLGVEMKNDPGRGRLLEIEARKRRIEQEYKRLAGQHETLGQEKMHLSCRLVPMRKRLRGAERAIETIKNPPAWGLEGISPDTLLAIERQARKTIRELK